MPESPKFSRPEKRRLYDKLQYSNQLKLSKGSGKEKQKAKENTEGKFTQDFCASVCLIEMI